MITHWPDKPQVAGSLVTGRVQAYRTGQEDQLGALGLVLNAAVLWTTRYLDAAVE